MNPLLRTVAVVPLFGLCTLLTAQEGEKGKPQDPPPPKSEKATSQTPPKDQDSAALAKDPAIKAIDKFINEQKIDKNGSDWKQKLTQPPKVEFDANTDYFWHLDTDQGPLKIRYFADTAPVHVTSGIYLARLGFYDGLIFHRIIPGFMAQGADPTGTGGGGPGYKFGGEFVGDRKHDKPGILSMAHAGPGTDGSQFFLTFAPTPHLDGRHTIWGEVVEGKETLQALEKLGSQSGRVATPPKITKSWISVAPKGKSADAKPADAKTPPKEGGGEKGK
jgi:peptidyl-prolyl cis-trans isomerase B (cyclophilin B)